MTRVSDKVVIAVIKSYDFDAMPKLCLVDQLLENDHPVFKQGVVVDRSDDEVVLLALVNADLGGVSGAAESLLQAGFAAGVEYQRNYAHTEDG